MPKNKKSTSTKKTKKSTSLKKPKNLSEAYINHPKTKALSDPNKFRQYVKENYHLIREKQPLMKGTDIMRTLGSDWTFASRKPTTVGKVSKTYGASKKVEKLPRPSLIAKPTPVGPFAQRKLSLERTNITKDFLIL